MVRPSNVGTSTWLPCRAGVANRLVTPTAICWVERPVAGSSACSTPTLWSSAQTRPPPITGEPAIEACQSTCAVPAESIRTARIPSSHGTYTTSPSPAAPPNPRHTAPCHTCPPTPPSWPCRSTYPVPDLPAMNTHFVPTSTGPIEPRSRSSSLSEPHVVGEYESSSFASTPFCSTLSL